MKWLSVASGFFVLLIAGLSFVLSFHALSTLGARTQAFPPGLVWIFPLIIDGAVVCFSLAALRATLERGPALSYIVLIVATTLSSVVFNVLSIEEGVLGKVLAAFPPILLAISFETFLRQLQVGIQRSQGTPPKEKVTHPPVQRERASGKPKARSKKERTRERRATVLELINLGEKPEEIAKKIGVSARTVFRDMKDL